MGVFFGQKLREARKARNLMNMTVATAAGVHDTNYSAIEAGRREPSDVFIQKLGESGVLGVGEDELRAWRDLDLIGLDGVRRLKRYMPEEIGSVAADTLTEGWFSDAPHPPTEEERELINRARDLGFTFPLVNDPSFWSRPEKERRKALGLLEALLDEQQSHAPRSSAMLREAM